MTTQAPERPNLDELRGKALEAGAKLRELRTLDPGRRGDTYIAELKGVTQEVYALDAELSIGERLAVMDILDQRRKDLDNDSRTGPSAAHMNLSSARTMGQTFVESDAYRNRRGRTTDAHEVRTLIDSGTGTGGAGIWRPVGTPFLPAQSVQQQRLFVRDVISVSPTTLSSVPFIRELNSRLNDSGATAVAEGAAKPEVTMQFELDDAPARKIAGWVPATEEIVADAPTLRGYIDTRLMYMLALAEERAVLNGSGTAPTLRGIRNTPGIQTQALVTDTAQTIAHAVGKVEDADGMADALAMNPLDYWASVSKRHADQFDGGFSVGAPFAVPGGGQLWGLPVIRTRAMPAGTTLVGAWRLGAQLFDREQATLRVTDSHEDYFVLNKLVILVEERVALAVHRPDWFVETTIVAGS